VEGADQQLTVAGQHLRVLHTPGHTPGSSTLLYRGGAFTGDTLYRDGVGLVKLPGENIEVLRRTLRSLCTGGLRPETTVFPGHGGAAYLHEILSQNHALSDFLDSTDALVPATQQGGVS
jgi:glyoxylase-like metal-dependent hydrolase (beta-lactamase superfamily II)